MDKLMELKTSRELLGALAKASSVKQTASEVDEQRISFIYGSIKGEITRTRIQEVLTEQRGSGS